MLKSLILVVLIPFSSSLQIDFATIKVQDIQRILLDGVSCAEIIQQFLERIEKYENGPLQLNAVITVNPHANDEASELDKYVQRTRSFVGTLHCVPVVVGDNIDVAHLPTTAGVTALSHSIAPRDADVVQLLKNQGAIIVAKGNISPFAWEHRYVESQTGGLEKNAYCTSCTTYGASGGAAQGVAVVYGLIGLGTDSGGSIALPASAASCFGLRPTWNLVSNRGVIPVNEFVDVIGPFARDASDLAVVMDILDPSKRGRGYYDRLTRESGDRLDGLRMAIVADAIYGKLVWPMPNSAHSSSLVTIHLNEEIRRLIDKSIRDTKSTGAEIVNVTLNVQRVLPYLSAFGEFDVTSCSAFWLDSYLSRLTSPAPYHSLNQLLHSRTLPHSFQRFYENAQRKSMLQQCDTASETFVRARAGLREHIMQPLFDGDKDVILFPLTPDFPSRIHDRRDYPLMGVQLAALAGYPSLTMPVGFGHPVHNSHTTQSPGGLPVAVLLVAKPDRMEALLKVASVYQRVFGKIVLPESVSGGTCLRNINTLWLHAVAVLISYAASGHFGLE